MRYYLWIVVVSILASCDTNRVFEEHKDFDADYWVQETEVVFDFEVTDTEVPYNIYSSFRNASGYPYHNLYYQFTLTDSSGMELTQELKNVNLFDPKTGVPLGSGLGDLFDHRQLILGDYTFQKAGIYHLSFEQYMRRDTLPLVLSVGARVEWALQE